jgi:hypothetical protein
MHLKVLQLEAGTLSTTLTLRSLLFSDLAAAFLESKQSFASQRGLPPASLCYRHASKAFPHRLACWTIES